VERCGFGYSAVDYCFDPLFAVKANLLRSKIADRQPLNDESKQNLKNLHRLYRLIKYLKTLGGYLVQHEPGVAH
jgi:hypothetical protein